MDKKFLVYSYYPSTQNVYFALKDTLQDAIDHVCSEVLRDEEVVFSREPVKESGNSFVILGHIKDSTGGPIFRIFGLDNVDVISVSLDFLGVANVG